MSTVFIGQENGTNLITALTSNISKYSIPITYNYAKPVGASGPGLEGPLCPPGPGDPSRLPPLTAVFSVSLISELSALNTHRPHTLVQLLEHIHPSDPNNTHTHEPLAVCTQYPRVTPLPHRHGLFCAHATVHMMRPHPEIPPQNPSPPMEAQRRGSST